MGKDEQPPFSYLNRKGAPSSHHIFQPASLQSVVPFRPPAHPLPTTPPACLVTTPAGSSGLSKKSKAHVASSPPQLVAPVRQRHVAYGRRGGGGERAVGRLVHDQQLLANELGAHRDDLRQAAGHGKDSSERSSPHETNQHLRHQNRAGACVKRVSGSARTRARIEGIHAGQKRARLVRREQEVIRLEPLSSVPTEMKSSRL